MVNNDKIPQDLLIDDNEREFNSQFEFFKLLYRIMERKNLAYESGDIESFYRSTMNLLTCAKPKLDAEGHKTETEAEIIALRGIWNKIIGLLNIRDDNIKQKNIKLIEFEIMEVFNRVNFLIFESGIIYPKRKRKSVEELREEDY